LGLHVENLALQIANLLMQFFDQSRYFLAGNFIFILDNVQDLLGGTEAGKG